MPIPVSSNDQLIEQEDAVGMYLSALLSDEPQENFDNQADINPGIIPPGNIAEVQVDSLNITNNETADKYDISKDQTEQSVSDYFNSEFQSLSFIVSNFKLCVPLQQLNGIIEWNGKITRLPGQADWCLGIMRIRGRNLSVIDLSRILHGVSGNLLKNGRSKKKLVQHVLLIGNGKWGLACDSVDDISILYKDDISWRPSGARELIMGTVINHMNLILNVDEFIRRLENSSL